MKSQSETPNKKPLSLEEAKQSDRCRICHRTIAAKMQPAGWKDRFESLLYPIHIVLRRGHEFAHKDCLPPEPPKPTSDEKPKNNSLDYWTHVYSDGKEKLGHTSDCQFWGVKICDCGLLTHLRFAHIDPSSLYPKFNEELANHERRMETLKLSPLAENMVSRFEQLLRQQATHYQERSCDECGQTVLDYIVNSRGDMDPEWPKDKPMFLADMFNQNKDNKGTTKTLCQNCG